MEDNLATKFPVESWQFFLECREALGMTKLQNVFGNVNTSQLYRWARNPELDGDAQAGPLLSLARLFKLLAEQGRADLAEAGMRILCEPCGAQVSFTAAHAQAEAVEPHTAAADLVEAVAELQRAARSGTDPKVVEALADVLMARAMELTTCVRAAQASGKRPRWSRAAVDHKMKPGMLARLFRRG